MPHDSWVCRFVGRKRNRVVPFPNGKLPSGFTVTAHAGAMNTPANSIESLSAAIAAGCDVAEIDVSFHPDLTPVIIHHASPEPGQGVPLHDAFAEIARDSKIRVNLDLKSVANLPAVAQCAADFGLMHRVFFTGVSEDWVPAVRSACPAIDYYLNCSANEKQKNDPSEANALAEKIANLGAIGMNTHFSNAGPALAEALRAKGLLFSLWTADSPKQQRFALSFLPDNITTKKPLQLIAAAKAFR